MMEDERAFNLLREIPYRVHLQIECQRYRSRKIFANSLGLGALWPKSPKDRMEATTLTACSGPHVCHAEV